MEMESHYQANCSETEHDVTAVAEEGQTNSNPESEPTKVIQWLPDRRLIFLASITAGFLVALVVVKLSFAIRSHASVQETAYRDTDEEHSVSSSLKLPERTKKIEGIVTTEHRTPIFLDKGRSRADEKSPGEVFKLKALTSGPPMKASSTLETNSNTVNESPATPSITRRRATSKRKTSTSKSTERSLEEFSVNPEDAIYNSRHQYVCVFHSSSTGQKSGRRTYGIRLFPYPYCTIAVYCCAKVDDNFTIAPKHPQIDVEMKGFKNLVEMKGKNPHLVCYLAIGGDWSDSNMFANLSRDYGSRRKFINHSLSMLHATKFDGLLLFWTYPTDEDKHPLISLLVDVNQRLKHSGFKAGVIIPANKNLNRGFPIKVLREILNNYTIIVSPPVYGTESYYRTFAHQSYDVIKMHKDVFADTVTRKDDGRYSLCHTVSLAGLTFNLKSELDSEEDSAALGPGLSGSRIGQPGKIAYDEACREKFEKSSVAQYSLTGRLGTRWVSYSNSSTIQEFVRDIHATVLAECTGIWDPEWDDFSGRCEGSIFPLTKASFVRFDF